jgi:hypothetical protein
MVRAPASLGAAAKGDSVLLEAVHICSLLQFSRHSQTTDKDAQAQWSESITSRWSFKSC